MAATMQVQDAAAAPRPPRPPWTWRATLSVLGLGLFGVVVGAVLGRQMPRPAPSPAARVEQAFLADTAASLQLVVEQTKGSPEAADVTALAHALVWREHGGGDQHRLLAEQALAGAPRAARLSPQGLYARALLVEDGVRAGRTDADADLDADLILAADAASTMLARATRATDAHARVALLERAATSSPSSLHATLRWARTAAAAGDLPLARAALGRIVADNPDHAGALVTAVVVGIAEEVALPVNRRRSVHELLPDERRLRESVLERGDALDDDTAVLTVMDHALHMMRGAELSHAQRQRLVDVTDGREALALSVVELALLRGDATTAEAVLKRHATSAHPGLIASATRLRIVQAMSSAELLERRRRVGATDGVSMTHAYALGQLRLQLDRPGLPLHPVFSTAVYPERRIAAALAEHLRDGEADRLVRHLQLIEGLVAAERALAAGDTAAAKTTLAAAGRAFGPSSELSLVQARIAARSGDVAGAINAIDAAIMATSDPELWLMAAQRSLDVGYQAGARRALQAFTDRGLHSAQAMALLASLEVQSGNLLAAQAALTEAARLGGSDDDVWMLRATIVTKRQQDPEAARKAATKLLALAPEPGQAIVDVWVADAAARAAIPEAAARLLALAQAHPEVPEVFLFWAQAHAKDPAHVNDVVSNATRAMKLLTGPLAVEARTLVASAKAAMKRAPTTTRLSPPGKRP